MSRKRRLKFLTQNKERLVLENGSEDNDSLNLRSIYLSIYLAIYTYNIYIYVYIHIYLYIYAHVILFIYLFTIYIYCPFLSYSLVIIAVSYLILAYSNLTQ